jgi:predicted metal-binding membrane protein
LLTTLVSAGYFFVWNVFGVAAFATGTALAAVVMERPALARATDRGRCGRSAGWIPSVLRV